LFFSFILPCIELLTVPCRMVFLNKISKGSEVPWTDLMVLWMARKFNMYNEWGQIEYKTQCILSLPTCPQHLHHSLSRSSDRSPVWQFLRQWILLFSKNLYQLVCHQVKITYDVSTHSLRTMGGHFRESTSPYGSNL
jgi:hypothetical protein